MSRERRERRRSTTTGQAAQLARIAARAAAAGSSSVSFTINHESYKPRGEAAPQTAGTTSEAAPKTAGTKSEAAPKPADAETSRDARRQEFLHLEVDHVAIHVATASSETDRVREPQVRTERPTDGDRPIEGSAVLNPGFLYQNGRCVEALLDIPERHPRSIASAVRATTIARRLAEAAKSADAPILFLHYPAAPAEPTGPAGPAEPPSGHTMRVSVAVDERNMAARLDLLAALTDLAEVEGLRLTIGEMGIDAVRGEWCPMMEPETTRFPAGTGSAEHEPRTDLDKQVDWALPVTVVGPARVGSTHAVLSVLAERQVGIVGISVSAMQEVAFINLLVAVPPRKASDGESTPSQHTVNTGLREVVERCGSQPPQNVNDEPVEVAVNGDAAGFRTIIGPPRLLSNGEDRQDRTPLWLLWDLPDGVPGTAALDAAVRALDEHHLDPRVDYARGRSLDDDRFRGRARVSIVRQAIGDATSRQEKLTDIVEKVEDKTRQQMTELYPTHGNLTFRIEWRESWLGARHRRDP